MEDSPLFNAGKGASYTTDGTVELDASIMDGRTMKAGGVAVARRIKNPISLARIVLEKTPHVLVAGEGVSALAQEMGVPFVPESHFYTEEKWNELLERMDRKVPFGTPIPRTGEPPRDDPPTPGCGARSARLRSTRRAIWPLAHPRVDASPSGPGASAILPSLAPAPTRTMTSSRFRRPDWARSTWCC